MPDHPDIDVLLSEVLALPKSKRSNWLQVRCSGHPDILAEVTSLLEAHEASGEFLDTPVSIAPQHTNSAPSAQNRVGDRIGAYRVTRLLAAGGMGQVYLAERDDQAYQQQVAIKIVPPNRVNLDLFHRERQTLADLDHPAITRILDGGELSPSGELYLIMEYVDGQTITDYVLERVTTTIARRTLFRQLVEAVSQAHQQNIIHCDIKPENVLVTHDGQVKLLDFGIAHLTDALASKLESSGVHAFSTGFASPERLRGEAPRASDDVFSLGMLFALLETAGSRVEPGTTQPQFSDPEAEAIFGKATHANPGDRYANAGELANELDAWQAHRPISAMPITLGYRLRKSFRRAWLGWIVATLAVSLALITGLASWLQHRAKQAQALNEQQAQHAISLNNTVLRELDDKIALVQGSTLTRLKNAEQAVAQLELAYHANPDHPTIKTALAQAHLRLGGFLAHPFKLHIGKFQPGRQHILRAYQLAHEAYLESPQKDTLEQLILAIRYVTAQLLLVEGKAEDALLMQYDLLDEFRQRENPGPLIQTRISTQYAAVARILTIMGKVEEAAVSLQRAADSYPDINDNMPEYVQERVRRGRNFLRVEQGIFELITGRYAEARPKMKQIVKHFSDKTLWIDRRRAVYAHHALACIAMLDDQSLPFAQQHLQEAKQLADGLVDSYPNAVSLYWLQNRFAPLNRTAEIGNSLSDWIGTFQCNQLINIHSPSAPPGGWKEVGSGTDFSFSEHMIFLNPG